MSERSVRSLYDALSGDYDGDNVSDAYLDTADTSSDFGVSEASASVDSGGSMAALRDWFGDTFYKDVVETEHWEGTYGTYLRETTGYAYSLKEIPVDMTRTVTRSVVDVQSCFSAVLVLMLFYTIVTWLRRVVTA